MIKKLALLVGMALMSWNSPQRAEAITEQVIKLQNYKEKSKKKIEEGYIQVGDYLFMLKSYDTNNDRKIDYKEFYIIGEDKPFIYSADIDENGRIFSEEVFIDVKRDGLTGNERPITDFIGVNDIKIITNRFMDKKFINS